MFGASGGGLPCRLPCASGVCGGSWGTAAGHDLAVLCLWLGAENGFFPLFRIKLAGSKPLAKPAFLQLFLQAREQVWKGVGHPASMILEKSLSPVIPVKQ